MINLFVFSYLRGHHVLDDHNDMVEQKILEFQALLETKIKKFEEKLALYAVLVDEMQYNGELEFLPKYFKRANQLDKRYHFLCAK